MTPLPTLNFVVAVRQSNLPELEKLAAEVSDPTSTRYGQFATPQYLAQLTRPSDQSLEAIHDWLANTPHRWLPSGCDVQLTLSRVEAETLFQTTFRSVVNTATGQRVHRAGGATVPSAALVYGLHELPPPPRMTTPLISSSAAFPVTPVVLRTTYNITANASGSKMVRQAVAGFENQTYQPANLASFFEQFVPSAAAGDAQVFARHGDEGPTGSREGVEATLDLEYIMGVAPGLKTEFWGYGMAVQDRICLGQKLWTL
jgi:tripeptidyl-peptidase-1